MTVILLVSRVRARACHGTAARDALQDRIEPRPGGEERSARVRRAPVGWNKNREVRAEVRMRGEEDETRWCQEE